MCVRSVSLGNNAKSAAKHLDRGVKHKNQLVFADLMFPPKHYNCKRYAAILVVMDAYTRYLTVHPVQLKSAPEINALMHRYIAWTERQPPPPPPEISTSHDASVVGLGILALELERTWAQ